MAKACVLLKLQVGFAGRNAGCAGTNAHDLRGLPLVLRDFQAEQPGWLGERSLVHSWKGDARRTCKDRGNWAGKTYAKTTRSAMERAYLYDCDATVLKSRLSLKVGHSNLRWHMVHSMMRTGSPCERVPRDRCVLYCTGLEGFHGVVDFGKTVAGYPVSVKRLQDGLSESYRSPDCDAGI